MSKPELGAKRQCLSCGAKFFDLNRNPIVCPKCGTVFQAAAPARAAARPAPADEEDAETPASAELVPLEDADAAAETAEPAAGDDADLGDQPADDTFLEEDEEENGDVAGLIDGDIENDEES